MASNFEGSKGDKLTMFNLTLPFFLRQVLLCLISLISIFGCSPNRCVPNGPPEMSGPFYVPERIRVALVLGSGGVRGMAHVGVIEELVAAGIPIDIIIGCSAGSIVGALYADNPNIEEIKTAVWKLRTNALFDIELSQCRYGLSQTRCMHKVLDDHLNADTFEELQIPLIVVATDLDSGELVVIGSGDLPKAVQASCSIPFVFVPCKHMGRILVDGGVINPVPVRVAQDIGAEVIIAVDLSELLDTTAPTHLFGIANRSAEIAFLWQNQGCCRGADVVIRPKTCDVGTFNESKKPELYQAGKAAAREHIPKILQLLSEWSQKECESTTSPYEWKMIQPRCYTPKIYQEGS